MVPLCTNDGDGRVGGDDGFRVTPSNSSLETRPPSVALWVSRAPWLRPIRASGWRSGPAGRGRKDPENDVVALLVTVRGEGKVFIT